MGAITYGVNGAGGFFTVDGQSVKYHSDIDTMVGFCLASSRICCETGQTCGNIPVCATNSSFLRAQQWCVRLLSCSFDSQRVRLTHLCALQAVDLDL